MRSHTIFLTAILVLGTGCGNEERIANLEKQNKELKAEVAKSHAAEEYDLQEKCSKDAKQWYRENWARLKDTLYLDYKNHYNKEKNACFIFVEYHSTLLTKDDWGNTMGLWDVTENGQYGDFLETHRTIVKPTFHIEHRLVKCEVEGKTCTTMEEFNELIRPYMSK